MKVSASYFSWPKNTTLTQTRALVLQKNSKKLARHMRYIDTFNGEFTYYLILNLAHASSDIMQQTKIGNS